MAVIRLTKRLWREYVHQNKVKAARQAAENRLREKREALIVAHLNVAEAIARQVWRKFTRTGQGGYGSRLELEDMIACANVGLVEAAGRWEPSRGDFAKYCYFRVRGAVLDAYRRQGYLELLHESIDEWLDEDSERGLGQDRQHLSLLAQYLTDPRPRPDELANRGKLRRLAEVAIERLPDEERDVIREALSGAGSAAIGQARGHSPAWARDKLATARERVAAEVQRRVA